MPRYFFGFHDETMHLDDEGQECETLSDVRVQAMLALPAIAKDLIPADGDKRTFTVIVRDQNYRVVYTATLAFAGLWVYAAPPT